MSIWDRLWEHCGNASAHVNEDPSAPLKPEKEPNKYMDMMRTGKDPVPPIPADARDKYKSMLPKPPKKEAMGDDDVPDEISFTSLTGNPTSPGMMGRTPLQHPGAKPPPVPADAMRGRNDYGSMLPKRPMAGAVAPRPMGQQLGGRPLPGMPPERSRKTIWDEAFDRAHDEGLLD